MKRRNFRWSEARVLISNDDGIHAPGLKMLEKVVRRMAKEVWVVAPETEQSAASHALTLRQPLRIRKLSNRRYAVNGTPTDSILLGLSEVMKDRQPDVVLSGVNRGANVGEDVTYSGTIAAAMEGSLLGVPSIALSQATDERNRVRWGTAEHWLPKVLEDLMALNFPTYVLININFPNVSSKAVTGVEVTRQGRREVGRDLREGTDPRGVPYFWVGRQLEQDKYLKGTDLEAIGRGAISVTPLHLDLTHRPSLKTLREIFP